MEISSHPPGGAPTQLRTTHWRRKGGAGGQGPLDFKIISKKSFFFQFRGVKTKFHHFYSPWKKFWENPLLPLPWKKFFRRPWNHWSSA